jgi:uncharacterized membrane protein
MFDKAEWLHRNDTWKILLFQFGLIGTISLVVGILSNLFYGTTLFTFFVGVLLLDARFPGIFD